MPDLAISNLASGALTAITLFLGIPVAVLFTEVMAAVFLSSRKSRQAGGAGRPSLAALVPAHNEGSRVVPTITDILAQLQQGDRLVVVADNCSDDTAAVAAAAGADVVERREPTKLGKGYALDWGVRHLASSPPEIVIIVDADCRLESGTIDLLSRRVAETARPVQALYLMSTPESSRLDNKVSAFAWRLKNWVRPLGLFHLDMPCQLAGTGMAFPYQLLTSVNLGSGELVEDCKLGLDLAAAGHPPLFCSSAVVTSEFAPSAEGRNTQQQRWEQGHLGLIATMAPRLLRTAIAKLDLRLLVMVLDLSVPPIVLLILLLIASFVATGLCALLGLSVLPLYLSTLSLAALAVSVIAAWWHYGREVLPPNSLIAVLRFVIAKMNFYTRLFGEKRATKWIRTDRD